MECIKAQLGRFLDFQSDAPNKAELVNNYDWMKDYTFIDFTRDKGLVLDGMQLKVVTIGENGITEADILTHDAHCADPGLQLMLAEMKGPDFPVALGILRDVEADTYDKGVNRQVEEVSAKAKIHCVDELLRSGSTWEVE